MYIFDWKFKFKRPQNTAVISTQNNIFVFGIQFFIAAISQVPIFDNVSILYVGISIGNCNIKKHLVGKPHLECYFHYSTAGYRQTQYLERILDSCLVASKLLEFGDERGLEFEHPEKLRRQAEHFDQRPQKALVHP